MTELLIGLLAFVVFAWIDALRAREAALHACRRATQRLGVQLLDETVVLRRLRPARNGDGRVGLCRHYSFEYSEQGIERRQGEIVLLGRHVVSLRGDWIDVAPTAHHEELPTLPEPATNLNTQAAETTDNSSVVNLDDYRKRRNLH